MANGVCDSYCKGCVYSNRVAGEDILCCVYYFKTNSRRPCPAGSGCTVKEAGRNRSAWRHENDATWEKAKKERERERGRLRREKKRKAKMRTLVCPICGKEFQTSDSRQCTALKNVAMRHNGAVGTKRSPRNCRARMCLNL